MDRERVERRRDIGLCLQRPHCLTDCLDLSTRESVDNLQPSHPSYTYVRGDVVDISVMMIEAPICFLQVCPNDGIPLHPSQQQSLVLLVQFLDHGNMVVVGITADLLPLINPCLGGDKLVLELPDLLLHSDKFLFKAVSLKGPPISTIKML